MFNQLLNISNNPGPAEYIGKIGKILSTDVWKLPVGDFTPVDAPDFPDVPAEVISNFSTDVKYLYTICKSVVKGNYHRL